MVQFIQFLVVAIAKGLAQQPRKQFPHKLPLVPPEGSPNASLGLPNPDVTQPFQLRPFAMPFTKTCLVLSALVCRTNRISILYSIILD